MKDTKSLDQPTAKERFHDLPFLGVDLGPPIPYAERDTCVRTRLGCLATARPPSKYRGWVCSATVVFDSVG